MKGEQHFHLIEEMKETADIIRRFDTTLTNKLSGLIGDASCVMLTGEGSSRIFPAKNAMFKRLQSGKGPIIITQNANDLAGIDLSAMVVMGASNSGRTKELIQLFDFLKRTGHRHLYGLTCNRSNLLEGYSHHTTVLDVGVEHAVAATKSVVAQALFYDLLFSSWGSPGPDPGSLANDVENAFKQPIDSDITETIAKADHVYFAGTNNGVAEELTLKTNEIVRKKSAFFAGTYLLHGVEEVVGPEDVIVMVDELTHHAPKIYDVFVDGIGAKVISLSHHSSLFPKVSVDYTDASHAAYVKLARAWKMLVEAGLLLGVDLDKPERARKVGNEFIGGIKKG